MSDTRVALLAGALLLAASSCAYAQANAAIPSESDFDLLPKPACDSYSMQTLPLEAFHWRQRACYWGNQLFTGSAISGAALFGAIGEWRHKPPEWPQGANGFGRQFGTRYLQGMTKSTGAFLIGALAREDPRPMPPPILRMTVDRFGCRPSTTIKARIGEALLRTVWRPCEDRWAPGRLAGSFASGFVSLAWAPPSQNKISTALVNSGTAFGGYIGNSLWSEFQGDLFGLVGRLLPFGKPNLAQLKKLREQEGRK